SGCCTMGPPSTTGGASAVIFPEIDPPRVTLSCVTMNIGRPQPTESSTSTRNVHIFPMPYLHRAGRQTFPPFPTRFPMPSEQYDRSNRNPVPIQLTTPSLDVKS